MKSLFVLSVILSFIFTLSFVSALPSYECSFTCTDGTKSVLPFIRSEEDCKLAVYYSECPKRKTPPVGYCVPWCAVCNKCQDVSLNKIESISFTNTSC
ncbi:hypothetical protein CYY_008131 [Polysphondylium violaceum]|uniref:Uncharacterized protein n=1 Tax=Polysphondylium violaceum TaxID=133409 RepID=A0A8J4PVY3_9MYCE|nr:hypothetical protein CYY_008131 [Polysphondylium violaceum]